MPFSPFVLSYKIIGTPFQQLQMSAAYTILDLGAIQPAKQERTGGSPAPYEALDAVVAHRIKQPEPEDVLRCLIVLTNAALEDRCLVKLPVVVTHRFDGVDFLSLLDAGFLTTEAVPALRDCQGIVGVGFPELKDLSTGALGHITIGLPYRDLKLVF